MDRMSFAGAIPVVTEGPVRSVLYGKALHDRLGWLVMAAVAGGAIGAIYALSTPPTYQAQALIQVGAQDASLRSVTPGSQPAPFDAGILRSRAIAAPVVESLGLDISARPLRAPLLGGLAAYFSTPGVPRGTWPASLGYAWGGERIDIARLTVPDTLLNVPLQLVVTQAGGYKLTHEGETLLQGRIGEVATGSGIQMIVTSIEGQPGTRFTVTRRDPMSTFQRVANEMMVEDQASAAGTVRIAWRDGDPRTATALVNGIAEGYIAAQAAQRRDDATDSLAFLTGELPRVQADLERAEAALTRYRSRSGSIAPTQDVQSFLQGSLDYQRQIAALRLERTKLLQRFTTESNEVKTVDTQIQELMRERRDMDNRAMNLSQTERQAVALTRDVKVAEDMYMSLRNKIEQLSLLQSDQSRPARLLDAALVPAMPAGPGPLPLTLFGAFCGMSVAAISVMLRRRLKPVVASADEAEARLGMPMLGDIAFSQEQGHLERQAELRRRFGMVGGVTVPDSPRLAAPRASTQLTTVNEDGTDEDSDRNARQGRHDEFLLARRSPHALAVEGLRNVRAALHFHLRNAPDTSVAITSPAPGAGKTFAAVNLAVLFAEAGQRVLLIDADMRRGKIASWFDQPMEPGLAEVLSGRVALTAAIQSTAVAGLSLLTTGATPANPSELLMMPTMAQLLRTTKQRFDLVIIDTPPVLSVADATLVASMTGSTLLVMRADSTLPSQVEETLKRLARASARLAGGTINGVAHRRSNRADFDTVNPYLGMPLPAARQAALKLPGFKPATSSAGAVGTVGATD